jgi:hypothetical protein
MTFDHLKIGFIFVAFAVIAGIMPAQSDTWWLLRAGQEMMRSGSVMLRDEFSYTARGSFWPNHAWLTELAFFGVYRLGGMPLLTALAATIAMAASWLSWRLVRGPLEGRLRLFSLGLAMTATAWAVRAQVVTMLCVALVASLLVRRKYWWLPVVFLLWANAHAAVALGVVMLVGALAGAFVGPDRDRWRLVAVTAVCVLVTLATPLGVTLWTDIPESIHRSSVNRLAEWLPPGASDLRFLPFWSVAALLSGLAVLRWRRLRDPGLRRLVFVALFVLPLAVRSMRNVGPFMLAGVPALSVLLFREFERADTVRLPAERYALNAGLFAAAVVGAAVWVGLAWAGPAPRLQWHPLAPSVVGAIRSCPGNVYNTYYDGGAVIWFAPDRPVFIDNRQDPYDLDFLQQNRAIELGGDHRALFERFRIECALLPRESSLARTLERAGWRTVASQAGHVVFRRAAPEASEGT